MLRFLAFVFSRNIYKPWSVLIALILRLKGIRVGKSFYIEGTPYLKIRGKYKNICIGNNVKIFGHVDLRNRENGQIIFSDNVEIDNDCRFVAANEATLFIGENCKIGPYSMFNAGVDIIMGQDSIAGGFVHMQSSDHGLAKGNRIWDQQHSYGVINVGQGVWVAGGATILKGVTIGEGAVVAAKALVNRNVEPYTIVGGVPAQVLGERK